MKKTIDYEAAHNSLFTTLSADDFIDRIYEFVQELFQKEVAKIYKEYLVINRDGTISEPKDDEQWHDDCWEDFFDYASKCIIDTLLKAGHGDNSTQIYRLMENAVHLSADEYINLKNYSPDMRDKAHILIFWAKELHRRLGGKDEDEGGYDYVEELEKIEAEMDDEIHKDEFGDPDNED